MTVQVIAGDCRDSLRQLEAESVHTVVTSPPYYGLRAYNGEPGMIGLEPTLDEHIANLVDVFREVRRVLRPDGTCWLNYGDSYAGGGMGAQGKTGQMLHRKVTRARIFPHSRNTKGFKPKDLMLLPARVAMALQEDGWYLRSEIIWHKPNPMPEAITDRPTCAHEKVFLLSKSPRYFYDAYAVRQPQSEGTHARFGANSKPRVTGPKMGGSARKKESFERATQEWDISPDGMVNLRNVWKISIAPFKDAHYATFPPALVERCLKAVTSSIGACRQCGSPFVVEYDHTRQGENNGGTQAEPKHPRIPLRRMRGDVHPRPDQEQTEGVLFSEVCGPLQRTNAPNNEGLDDHQQGLPDATSTGSSERDEGRLCDGASPCHGGESGPSPDKRRSGSPHRRRQAAQQRGQSGGDGQAEARCTPEADVLRNVPMLQSRVSGARKCTHCGCHAEPVPCVVLDCFGGAGTVGLVADRLQRDAIILEISEDYAAMARKRIADEAGLFADVK